MDISPLKEAGLTEGEIKVYIALTEIGVSTIGPILRESGITKSIIYRILDKLTKKGLVSHSIKEKTKYFQAGAPEKLITYVESKEKELKKNKERINALIPQLVLKQSLAKKSNATIFEGFKGLQSAYEKRYSVLNKGDEVILYGLPAEQPSYQHAYWKKSHKILEKKGIRCRMLYEKNVDTKVLKDRNSYKGCTAKKMPFNIHTPSWVMIYKDVTLIGIPQGELPLGFEITNQQVADAFKTYFEWIWKQSK